jgi:hypothetical protein
MKKFASPLALAAAITIGAVYYFTGNPAHISTPPLAALPPETNAPNTGTATRSNHTELSPASAPTEAAASAAPPKLPPRPSRQELALRYLQLIKPLLDSTNQADHDLIYTNLLRGLMAQSPAMAGELAESLPPGDVRQEFARRVAQAWAAVDPAGATTWAASLGDSEERKSTLTDVALQIAQTDPASAVGLAERLDFGGSNGTLENLAQLWADKDLAAALDWATQQPAGGQRDQIIARMAFVQAHTAPEDAVNLVVAQIPPGPAQDEAAMSVLNQWGMQDYPEAFNWVNQFQDGPLRDRALKELAGIAQYRQGMNQTK